MIRVNKFENQMSGEKEEINHENLESNKQHKILKTCNRAIDFISQEKF